MKKRSYLILRKLSASTTAVVCSIVWCMLIAPASFAAELAKPLTMNAIIEGA